MGRPAALCIVRGAALGPVRRIYTCFPGAVYRGPFECSRHKWWIAADKTLYASGCAVASDYYLCPGCFNWMVHAPCGASTSLVPMVQSSCWADGRRLER